MSTQGLSVGDLTNSSSTKLQIIWTAHQQGSPHMQKKQSFQTMSYIANNLGLLIIIKIQYL
jgi:hypothetical protein